MSEELLLNDRRGNLIHGCSLDQFFFISAKNLSRQDSNHWPPDPQPQALTNALQIT